ncbi:MAG: N-acetylmuramoyl-L-alanine amidase [Clostridiales bacterium]|nr:N-acetylmuramoyl-L-alanine amidase [Clostridiales bacterium]
MVVLAVVGCVGLLATATLVLALSQDSDASPQTLDAQPSALAATETAAGSSTAATQTPKAIEVPDVVGRTLAEAYVVLEAAGLVVKVADDVSVAADAVGEARKVRSQEPSAGMLLPEGMAVTLVVPAETGTTATSLLTGVVVCIDPGHQSRGDNRREPVGPGATETKARVTGGTTGVETRVPEYEIALQISMNLKARLEAAGVTVVMTRTTNDVNISNSERARMANEAGADLFVRIHADGSTDPARAGIATLFPGPNRWTGGIAGPSERAARLVHDAVVASTGAGDLGLKPRTDLTGFNWATVPSVLIECGFMTNPVEDRLLSSPHYQDKLAEGIAAGILAFVGE